MPGKTGRSVRPVPPPPSAGAYTEYENKGDTAAVNPRDNSMTHARASASAIARTAVAFAGGLRDAFLAQPFGLVRIDAAQRVQQFGGVLA